MLENIRIRSLGVIDQAEIEIGPGFTALTGETGAGKTMVLTALGLVLGAKGDAALVRTGAERLAVAATFKATPEVIATVEEQGGESEEGVVVLARMVSPDGRTRALVGGASAPAGVLTEIGENLISVHAQMSTSRLLKTSRQREILDRFGVHQKEITSYKEAYATWKAAESALVQFLKDQSNAAALAGELSALIERVEEVKPLSGEYSTLESDIARLSHHDEIARAIEIARGLANDEGSASETAGQIRRALEAVKGKDPRLDEIIDRATEISLLINDLGADISRYQDDLEIDPAALDASHDRLSKIQSLLRRFGEEQSADGYKKLLVRYEDAQERMASLNLGQEKADQLAEQARRAKTELAKAAERLSQARSQAAKKISESVTNEVRALAMPHATVTAVLSRKEVEDGLAIGDASFAFDANGIDSVEFQLAATASTPSVPIAKGASGGELSRVMLALEVVLAEADPVPTYVFDEVDAGIGGQAALEVGRRLARLAQHAQVIVVTHLAQVAAFADHHVLVAKGETGSVTTSEVKVISGREREEELARMMAGLADSSTAQASAAELLALGARER